MREKGLTGKLQVEEVGKDLEMGDVENQEKEPCGNQSYKIGK